MSARNLAASCMGNAAAMLILIFLSFFVLGAPFVWLLKMALETLNSFGSGML